MGMKKWQNGWNPILVKSKMADSAQNVSKVKFLTYYQSPCSCPHQKYIRGWVTGWIWNSESPLLHDRHLSYDGCLELRLPELFCVVLCTEVVICTLRWAVLTVLWIAWVLSHWTHFTVHRFICVYVFVFCVVLSTAYVFYYCNTVGWTWWDWSLSVGPYLPSVLRHCSLGHLIHENLSQIWPDLNSLQQQTIDWYAQQKGALLNDVISSSLSPTVL